MHVDFHIATKHRIITNQIPNIIMTSADATSKSVDVQQVRITNLNDCEINKDGEFVLYWMIASRRLHYNSGLQRAVEIAAYLDKPLLVIEAVSASHKFANDRILTFMIQGLVQNQQEFESRGVRFIPWVSTPLQSGTGLMQRLSKKACAVITDMFPTYYPNEILKIAKQQINVRFEAVDSNGILPIDIAKRSFPTAHSFRRHLHDHFVTWWSNLPKHDPTDIDHDLSMDEADYQEILRTCEVKPTPLEWMWRVTQGGTIGEEALTALDIDHSVPPVYSMEGGRNEALRRLSSFMAKGLDRYHTHRNNPTECAASGLSPWFHFGHLSTTEVVKQILDREKWSPEKIDGSRRSSRSGWWGLSEPIESFLDQILTWRELGFNFAYYNHNHTSIDSIPEWAKESLKTHLNDPRENYSFKQLEDAETSDELWNAAQRQLKRLGIIHNYMRMIWGKRILEWAPDPETAAKWMIELNDKWALDGRDPNSYTGIFWVMGRHDRAWGPERPIFGKVRYMSSANTARKINVKEYLSRWAQDALTLGEFR